MKKPQDVRLLLENFKDMARVASEDGDDLEAELNSVAIAVATWIIDEPERACDCGREDCKVARVMREWHAEFDEWLAEDRGAMN